MNYLTAYNKLLSNSLTSMNMDNFFEKKQNFFDNWAKNYDCLLTTIFYQAVHQRVLDYTQFPENSTILDLGCGTGKMLNRILKNYPSIKAIGYDFSAEMLREAQEKNNYPEQISFVEGNVETLPFPDNSFDAVFNSISFLHYPDPEKVLREIKRVLKPQGKYYLADYGSPQNIFRVTWFSPGGLRFYGRSKREEFAQNVGLSIVKHYDLLGPVLLTIFQKTV